MDAPVVAEPTRTALSNVGHWWPRGGVQPSRVQYAGWIVQNMDAQCITATRGRKGDCLASCTDQNGVEGRRLAASRVGFLPALPAPDKHAFTRIRRSNSGCLMHFRTLLPAVLALLSSLLLSALVFRLPGMSRPLRPVQAFSCSLDGRHSADYYGSAAPAQALVTSPPTLFREARAGSGVARTAISPSAVGTFPLSF